MGNDSINYNEKIFNKIILIFQNYRFIFLGITLFSIFSFLITYNFLYGYYFGGGIERSFSNFEIFQRIIPFHLNTLTMTWLIITLSSTLLIYSLKLIKEKGIFNKLFSMLSLVIFHIGMTVFFANKLSFMNTLKFSVIWIFPLFLILFLLFTIYAPTQPFKTLSGVLFGISLFIFLVLYVGNNTPKDLIVILFIFAVFIFGYLFTRIPNNGYIYFIFLFPYFFLVEVFIISKVYSFQNFNHNYVILFFIPLIISIVIAYVFRNLLDSIMRMGNLHINPPKPGGLYKWYKEIIKGLKNKDTRKGLIIIILISLFGSYIIIPKVSMTSAKIIRTFLPDVESQMDIITYKDIDGTIIKKAGKIIAEKDNVIYISNERWELEQIKINKYIVERKEFDSSLLD